MQEVLPELRSTLDVFPSPIPEQPGLIIRDPLKFSRVTLVVPPALSVGLAYFDGRTTLAELEGELRARGATHVSRGDLIRFLDTLNSAGFLRTAQFDRLRLTREKEFQSALVRSAAHSGSGYPETVSELSETLDGYHRDLNEPAAPAEENGLLALAAPHVSPYGGAACYASAYRRLSPAYADRTFVILGTSHYGAPESFGLTKKDFITPYGAARVDKDAVDTLARAAGSAVRVEDYCHAIEHSIEFQVIFLQHVLKSPEPRILPILCGPLSQSLTTGKAPEQNESVRRFFEALGELAAKRPDFLFVLGVDLAHVGRRYGDRSPATAFRGHMEDVQREDQARIDRICAGDAEGYFELMRPEGDALKWCGYSPIYTFLKALPKTRGEMIRYDQWNIDETSVVSFVSIAFHAADAKA